MAWRRLAGTSLVLAGLLAGGPARADGAFPDGQTILTPRSLPGEILLATNFGVVESTNGGQAWLWSCEQPINNYGRLYQMGPAPGYRLFAIANSKLIFSDDRGCVWQVAAGSLAGTSVQDAFPDPGDAGHVLAVTLTFGDAGASYMVVASRDGGTTFGAPIFTADPGDLVTGVEIASSDSNSIHLALSHGSLLAPALARTDDGGATWALVDLSAALGLDQVRILAVDRDDPGRVFLRGLGSGGDTLAVANGVDPVTVPLSFPNGQMTAFVQTEAGPILAAGNSAGAPALFRSDDGGASFAKLPGAPAILSLAERDGILYAATDTASTPFAQATSDDGGMTWTPGLNFAAIDAIAACVATTCQSDCQARAAQKQWPAAMCGAAPPTDAAVDPPVPHDAGEPPPPVVDAAAPRDAMAVPAPVDAGVRATVD
ncbi:MAG TPA: hypothetical protein VN962_12745, partial [Polyangia bacterium]|nr:hypothetical protein [Polyangia bacterium]